MNFSVRNPGGKKDSWSRRGKSADECKIQHGTNLFHVSQGGIFPLKPRQSVTSSHKSHKSMLQHMSEASPSKVPTRVSTWTGGR